MCLSPDLQAADLRPQGSDQLRLEDRPLLSGFWPLGSCLREMLSCPISTGRSMELYPAASQLCCMHWPGGLLYVLIRIRVNGPWLTQSMVKSISFGNFLGMTDSSGHGLHQLCDLRQAASLL